MGSFQTTGAPVNYLVCAGWRVPSLSWEFSGMHPVSTEDGRASFRPSSEPYPSTHDVGCEWRSP
jgi:hypothetical protein